MVGVGRGQKLVAVKGSAALGNGLCGLPIKGSFCEGLTGDKGIKHMNYVQVEQSLESDMDNKV